MPVKPSPFTLRCPKCGWKKTVAPQSDVLSPGDFLRKCEKCWNADLVMQQTGGITATLEKWLKKVHDRTASFAHTLPKVRFEFLLERHDSGYDNDKRRNEPFHPGFRERGLFDFAKGCSQDLKLELNFKCASA